MRYVLLIAALVACAHNPMAPPPPPVDPPAVVHVINQTGMDFNAWTIIIGADLQHSGVALQSGARPGGYGCMNSGSTTGERRFVEAAVVAGSRLDSLLQVLSIGNARRDAFADSLARGLLTPAALLAAYPGLVTATLPFDPAPAGWAPTDIVPWKWTATTANPSPIVVDTSDHICR